MLKKNINKIVLYFFCLAIASHLWAGGDKTEDKKKKRPIEEVSSVAAPRKVRRTNVFCNAIREIERAAKKCTEKARCSMLELTQALNCMCLDSQTLDRQGELILESTKCKKHPGIEGAPPLYEGDGSVNAVDIELREVYERSLVLINRAAYSLVEAELERVLENYPGYQGRVINSAILYQVLRVLYLSFARDEQALVNLEQEFKNLPLKLIEEYDPMAFIHYAELLRAKGRTDEAYEFLRSCVNSKSRSFIRYLVALWKAKTYEKTGNLKGAENAYIEALVTSENDPEAYLTLINFYFEQGEQSLAEMLTRVMRQVILPSKQWQEYQGKIEALIHDQLPESLRLYNECSYSNLLDAIKFWIDKSELDESSAYWVPLVRALLTYSDIIIANELLVDVVSDLSMSPDQRLNYYRALYIHHRSWARSSFFLNRVVRIMLSQADGQAVEMAQSIVEHDRMNQYFEKKQGDIQALEHLVQGYQSRGETGKAINALIELIEQYRYRNCFESINKGVAKLARFMTAEQAATILQSMFENFAWVHAAIPDMINSLCRAFGEKAIANMIEALLAEQEDFFTDSIHLTHFLQKPETYENRFQGPVWEALLTHKSIKSSWASLEKERLKFIADDASESDESEDASESDESDDTSESDQSEDDPEEAITSFISGIGSFREKSALHPLGSANKPRPQKKTHYHTPANRLSELLRSINIIQHRVPGDGYCMWHALSYGLQRAGIDHGTDFRGLQALITQSVQGSSCLSDSWEVSGSRAAVSRHPSRRSYAPGHWGLSDHLAAVTQHFNIHVIELLQTGSDQLSGTHFQPQLSTGGSVMQTPLVGAYNISGILQELHNAGVPFIIMINNTQVNEGGSLVLNDGNHWTAGVWSPSPVTASDEPEAPFNLEHLFPDSEVERIRRAILVPKVINGFY